MNCVACERYVHCGAWSCETFEECYRSASGWEMDTGARNLAVVSIDIDGVFENGLEMKGWICYLLLRFGAGIR